MKEMQDNKLKNGGEKVTNKESMGFRCEICSYDFGEKRELRCPRCGALQKCGMSCSGNCLKCNIHSKKA